MQTFREEMWAVSPTLSPGTAPSALPASPFAHALYIFLGVVAVAVAVARGGRKVTPPLPHPQPLGGDAELAGRLGDPVGGAPVLSHATTVRGADSFGYRKRKEKLFRC